MGEKWTPEVGDFALRALELGTVGEERGSAVVGAGGGDEGGVGSWSSSIKPKSGKIIDVLK